MQQDIKCLYFFIMKKTEFVNLIYNFNARFVFRGQMLQNALEIKEQIFEFFIAHKQLYEFQKIFLSKYSELSDITSRQNI